VSEIDDSAWEELLDAFTRREVEIARLRATLKEAESVLGLVERSPAPDPVIDDEIEALGLKIGFGAMMKSAERMWSLQPDVMGGEFVAGPCRVTVINTLAKIRKALAQ
jgi:hypothetical protein